MHNHILLNNGLEMQYAKTVRIVKLSSYIVYSLLIEKTL